MREEETHSRGNNKVLFILMILLPGLVFLYFMFLTVLGPPKQPKLRYYVATAVDGTDTTFHQLPDFQFINEQGQSVDQSVMDDKIVVSDYFFTTCPTICPVMTQNLTMVQEYFDENEDVLILSHTVDPETDTPEKLLDYAEAYEVNPKQWMFLTGSKKDLYEHARRGYFITALQGDGGPEDFIHSEKIVLVDKNKHIRGYYDGTKEEEVKRMIEHIEILKLEFRTHKKYRDKTI